MATIVDRPGHGGIARSAAHHVRDPAWTRPPHHTRRARRSRPVRHAGGRRRYVWRDLGLALLTLVAAVGVVVGLLHTDPTMRAAVVDLLRGAGTAARAWLGDLPWP